jgi:MFS family permease
MVAVLGPEFASGVLKLRPEDLVYIVGPAGVGIVIGGLLVGRIAPRLGPERTIDTGLTLAGCLLVSLALLVPVGELLWINDDNVGRGTILIAAAIAGLLGLANAMILVPSQTFLQSASPEHIRARVYATFFTVSNGVAFIPIIFAGALADLFGVIKVLVGVGVILILVGISQLGTKANNVRDQDMPSI